MTMGTAAANTIPEVITYNGNTINEQYRSGVYTSALTSQASFDNFSPYTNNSKYYLIVKPKTPYSLNSKVKVTESGKTPIYQWSQAITSSDIDEENSFTCEPKPIFKSYARLYTHNGSNYYSGSAQTYTALFVGKYKMECWGAKGGDYEYQPVCSAYSAARYLQKCYRGGHGGYTKGTLQVDAPNKEFYIYVGGYPGKLSRRNADLTISKEGGTTAGSTIYDRGTTYGENYFMRGTIKGGWNGGGIGSTSVDMNGPQTGYPGGGATDIRITDGDWNSFNSLKTRIMVAGGGGGTGSIDYNWGISLEDGQTTYSGADGTNIERTGYGGAGGGLEGGNGTDSAGRLSSFNGTGGTQDTGGNAVNTTEDHYTNVIFKYGPTNRNTNTSWGWACDTESLGASASNLNKGSFGEGGQNIWGQYFLGGCAGGGGWYGGGAATRGHGAGGGGSSFIAGFSGCKAIDQSSTSSNISHRSDAVTTISGTTYTFTDAQMIDGKGREWSNGSQGAIPSSAVMPSPTSHSGKCPIVGVTSDMEGRAYFAGNAGHGYARITFMPYGN